MFALYDPLPDRHFPNPYEDECYPWHEDEKEPECMDQDWLEEM